MLRRLSNAFQRQFSSDKSVPKKGVVSDYQVPDHEELPTTSNGTAKEENKVKGPLGDKDVPHTKDKLLSLEKDAASEEDDKLSPMIAEQQDSFPGPPQKKKRESVIAKFSRQISGEKKTRRVSAVGKGIIVKPDKQVFAVLHRVARQL